MTYVALPTKNPGDVLTSALWNTYLQGNADSGFMRMIADTTLGGASSSISFASIPVTFAHLLLVVEARGDAVATSVAGSLRFNGDTAANYDSQMLRGNAATVSAQELFAQTSILFADVIAASSAAGLASGAEILIPNYLGTTFNKKTITKTSAKTGTATGNLFTQHYDGHWRSSAAINQITLILASGNYAAGSRATLYGLPQ